MMVFAAAIVLLTALLCSVASAQTNGPPGGEIQHVGPLSPSGQSPGVPPAPGAGTDGRPESGDLQFGDAG
jgi:hypothetical protein